MQAVVAAAAPRSTQLLTPNPNNAPVVVVDTCKAAVLASDAVHRQKLAADQSKCTTQYETSHLDTTIKPLEQRTCGGS
jgi:hypothetical protein